MKTALTSHLMPSPTLFPMSEVVVSAFKSLFFLFYTYPFSLLSFLSPFTNSHDSFFAESEDGALR